MVTDDLQARRDARPCPICDRPLVYHAPDCPYHGSSFEDRQRAADAMEDLGIAMGEEFERGRRMAHAAGRSVGRKIRSAYRQLGR